MNSKIMLKISSYQQIIKGSRYKKGYSLPLTLQAQVEMSLVVKSFDHQKVIMQHTKQLNTRDIRPN